MLRFLAVVVMLLSACLPFMPLPASAHFFGATKQVGSYQIVFQPYPPSPVIGTNSSLNFSVLTPDGNNVYNVYASIVLMDKHTGQPIYQTPYRLYEISDITTFYTFNKTGDYVATIQTRIPGDKNYSSEPLAVSFDLSAFPPGIPLDELLLYYVTPAAVVIAGIAIYLHSKNKI
jgi:hypothetical protein